MRRDYQDYQPTPKIIMRVVRFLGLWSYLIALFGSLAVLVFLLVFGRWCSWQFLDGLESVYWTAFPCLVGLSIACSQIAYNDVAQQIAHKKLNGDEMMKEYNEEWKRFIQSIKEEFPEEFPAEEDNQEGRG